MQAIRQIFLATVFVMTASHAALANQISLTCNRINDPTFPPTYLEIDTITWSANRIFENDGEARPNLELSLLSVQDHYAAWLTETHEIVEGTGAKEYAARIYLLDRQTMHLQVAAASLIIMQMVANGRSSGSSNHLIFQCSRPL